MCVDREQQNSYNEGEQNPIEDIKRALEEAKEIAILEQRKKHCKNYLELKQINRRLNLLKLKQGKRRS